MVMQRPAKPSMPVRFRPTPFFLIPGRRLPSSRTLVSEETTGLPQGAVASANLYSLVETAKANGVEPNSYLALLFAQLPHAATIGDVEALLPWNVKQNICR
jgi:hypothetical protein